MSTHISSLHHQKGFTIIELMIALSILSLILLMSTVVLVQIGKLYSKGVNAASTQNAARTIITDVGASLQFSGEQPSSCAPMRPAGFSDSTTCAADSRSGPAGSNLRAYSYCIGTTRYSYILNSKLVASAAEKNQSYHVLWRDTMKSDGACPALNLFVGANVTPADELTQDNSGSELLPANMSLTRFYVGRISDDLYGIDVWLAFGDIDQLNLTTSNSGGSDLTPGAGASEGRAGAAQCKSEAGQEYCATSQLSTIITRRL